MMSRHAGKFSARPARRLEEPRGIYTVAPQMFRLFEQMPRVARSSVLTRGETGTGKELVARAVRAQRAPR